MADIGFSNKAMIISRELRDKMTDSNNNWKIRTEAIDEIFNIVSDKIQLNPEYILNQSEALLEFFIQLLGDQNFKIILTTLTIISNFIN